MKKLTAVLTVIFVCFIIYGYAGASILTFDDITSGNTASLDMYGGLTWTNMSVIHEGNPVFGITNHGYHNGVVSGDYVAFNDFEHTASVSYNSGQFDFNGAYLTAAWNNGLNITVIGKLNGVNQYSRTVTVDIDSPTWFDFNFAGTDELVFLSSGGTSAFSEHPGGVQFAMDNFTFNESLPVPIPSTIWFLGSGLLGLAGCRSRFRKR